MTCSVQLLQNGSRRGVAFLEDNSNKDVDILEYFKRLPLKEQETIKARFDHWIGGNTHDDWFHGWNKREHGGKYVDCFQFRYKETRLYGFLCHPNKRETRYVLCVLTTFVKKYQSKTETVHLDRILRIREDIQVKSSIDLLFP